MKILVSEYWEYEYSKKEFIEIYWLDSFNKLKNKEYVKISDWGFSWEVDRFPVFAKIIN